MSLAADAERLTLGEAEVRLASSVFTTSVPGRVGVEVELLTRDSMGASASDHALAELDRSPLPSGGRVTEEPGGQVELSTRICSGLTDATISTACDLAELRRRSAAADITLLGEGTDPLHLPPRRSDHPRYRAMESYLDRYGVNGRRMMRATASLQVTVESGVGDQVEHRWKLLHAIGPALVATFANSPFVDGHDTGWASARQGIWWSLDPARTWPVPLWQTTADPTEAYVRYALNAPVMIVHSIKADQRSWAVDKNFTFTDWITAFEDLGIRAPTWADLEYHLTTLFPPVRPRGAVEVRYLDAQRGDRWVVPLAVLFAIIEDADVTDRVLEVTEVTAGRWLDAARFGLADRDLATSATALLEIATASLERSAAPSWIGERVARFADDYTQRGRCPADDLRAVGPGAVPMPYPVIDAAIPSPVGVC